MPRHTPILAWGGNLEPRRVCSSNLAHEAPGCWDFNISMILDWTSGPFVLRSSPPPRDCPLAAEGSDVGLYVVARGLARVLAEFHPARQRFAWAS